MSQDKIHTERAFVCPRCNKQRLYRATDFVLTDETREIELPDGKMMEVPIDICHTCEENILNKHFKPKKTEVKKVLKAMQEDDTDLGDKSLEEML